MIWQPIIYFDRLLEFKQTPIYGQTDSSGSMVFPFFPNRIFWETFQLTFSCNFDFTEFPFDSHACPLEYGDNTYSQELMRFNVTQAVFGNVSTKSGGDSIILDDLPFPFEFQLVILPNFELRNVYNVTYSYTGIVLKMRRKSPGQLLCGYFYPTAAFALLSMISFLIKPDMVSSFLFEHNFSKFLI